MSHKDQETLLKELEQAHKLVKVGSEYKHYKNPDKLYKVIEIAILEASDEACVIYQAQYGDKLSFVRPLSSWLDTVEWSGQKVPRFTKI